MGYAIWCTTCDIEETVDSLDDAIEMSENHMTEYEINHFVEIEQR